MNRISVITINYNNISGLENTFRSVFSQNPNNFEYIVIDGGSTDGSYDLILQHADKIDYFVSGEDNGIYHAMNKGIKVANGDFVIFMNSGDLFFDQHQIANIVKELKYDDDIVYGDVRLLNMATGYDTVQRHPAILSFQYFYNQTICHQACIIKKSLFDSVFYFNERLKIVSDWEFLIVSLFIHQVNYRKIEHVIAVFDCSGVSTNSQSKAIAKQERAIVMDQYFSRFKEDYKELASHSSLRSQQLLLIQNSKFLRRIVSILFFVMLQFLPKKQ